MVSRTGFASMIVRNLEIPAGRGPFDLGAFVLAPGVSVEGVVTDAEGQALQGATVFVARSSPRPLQPGAPAATSGPQGRFEVGDLIQGERFDLQVQLPGYRSATLPGVRAPTIEPIALVLQQAARVSGRVVDTDGAPIPGARVTADPEGSDAGPLPTAQSGREGGFSLDDVAPGPNRLTAFARGYLQVDPVVLEVPPGGELDEVQVVLRRGTATVEGRVSGSEDEPVAGARVFAASVSATTDGEGFYVLREVAPGHRTITATYGDFSRLVSRSLEVQPGANTLDLSFRGHSVSGTIVGPGGSPIAGATVTLRGVAGTPGFSKARSSADGSFEVSGVADGVYGTFVSKQGFAGGDTGREIRVQGGPVTGVTIRLETGGAIVGRVSGLAPERVAELIVAARGDGGSGFGDVDRGGEYRIPHLAPGDWTVVAQLGGHRVEERVHLEPGVSETVLDLAFGEGLALAGRVLCGEEPVTGARISLTGVGLSASRFALTDHRGEFGFEDLEPGTYRIHVRGHTEDVDLVGDRTVSIELESGRVSGRVIDAGTQNPVPGATVSLSPLAEGGIEISESGFRATSDTRGRFVLDRVSEGAYRLHAGKDGYASAAKSIQVEGPLGLEGVDLLLEPSEGLVLLVRVFTGAAPAQLFAAVLGPDERPSGVERAVPDAEGRIRLRTVPPGTSGLLVAAPGTAAIRIQGRSPGPPLTVDLPPEARLEVNVPDLGSSTIQATLTLSGLDGRPVQTLISGRVESEWRLQSGRVTVRGLPAGRWVLAVRTIDGRSRTSMVTTLPGALQSVTVE